MAQSIYTYLAVDLGATSGRTVLATFNGQRIEMREFTRFENPQLPLGGHVFWDLPHLYNEILRALRQVKTEGIELQSIGIDTWGCDFAFFDKNGQLLGLPYCYRDPHTDGSMERFFAERMPKEDVYARTGIQFMPFNSLFHLFTLQGEDCTALAHADKVLFIPDALIYMLTGEAVCEYTVASTSQMLNPTTGDLDADLLQALGLPRERFGRLVQPGERVGVLTAQVQAATGLGAIPVIHVPEGATPKDGPSAGITIATSIASALTQRKVRKNTAMTGEITLRGKVLPVGGIKEKILAAKRAGITDIVMCKENEKDILEIPDMYLKGVTFHYVENVQDVWDFALTNQVVDHPLDFTIPEEKDEKKK